MSRLQFKYDPTNIAIYSQKRGYCKGAIQDSKPEEEVKVKTNPPREQAPGLAKPPNSIKEYCGQFSEFHVCFCGLDPGSLKFETVRTNKQHICF